MNSALLISSTGSPQKAEIEQIREFLKNFLGDKKLIKIPYPILYLILKFRPKIIKKKYEKIIISGNTPLNYFMKELKENLQKNLPELKIEIGNLYAPPYLKDKIKKLKKENFRRIYLLPLYPQGSLATTEILKYHFNKIIEEENLEGLIFPEYYRHPKYIKAVSEKIKEKKENFDFIIFSYHGLPVKMEGAFEYKEKCIKTTELVMENLNFSKENTITAFQSRFGFGRWLKPSTLKILKDISKRNFKKIAIISPSFPVDCLETLYDINIYFKDYFKKISGRDLIYIEALNSSKEHIEFLKHFIKENI